MRARIVTSKGQQDGEEPAPAVPGTAAAQPTALCTCPMTRLTGRFI
jgi:hypothetical protein